MNTTKFREAILYVSQGCADDSTFGATKLNKILFAADMAFYFVNGRAITEVDYMKLTNGPVPRQLVPVRSQMVADGLLEIQPVPCGEYVQKRPVAKRQADLSVFDEAEVKFLDEAIRALRGHYARTVSEWSHGFIGWQIADEGEDIPYYSCLIDNRPLSADEIAWGEQIANGVRN